MSDEWDFYACQVDGNPASIFIDLGIRNRAPLPNMTELAWLRLYMRQPREDGLSSKEEFGRLNEIEEALNTAAIGNDATLVYVGRNTSDGCRDFYFYGANGVQAECQLSSAMVPFPEYEFETGSRSDPGWSVYFTFLFPSKRSYRMILNNRVLETLASHGDKHEIERQVQHWIYFTSPHDRDRFYFTASQQGYRLVDKRDDSDGERPFALQVERLNAVDPTTIHNAVLELFDLAQECNGDYDGWETSVEKGS
jgi:regulator of RNase E activity RraB